MDKEIHDVAETQDGKTESRRVILKAALMSAPLIVTLRSRPAHADLQSLGSIQVPYGPELYVTQTDIQNSGGALTAEDLGRAINPDPSDPTKFHVVEQNRRNLTPLKTFTRTQEIAPPAGL